MRKIVVAVAGGLLSLTAACSGSHHLSSDASAVADQSSLSSHSGPAPVARSSTLRSGTAGPAQTEPATTSVTQRLVIRPVTAQGRPAPGYTVTPTPGGGAATCDRPQTESPTAVDDNIVFCLPSALSAQACWAGPTAGQVLCLTDAASRNLVEYQVDGPVTPVVHRAVPSPLQLVLSDGTICGLRDGGAWAGLADHPGLTPTYGCTTGSATSAVWSEAKQDGVDRDAPLWTVRVAPFDDSGGLRTLGVVSATFVGTAG